MPKLRIFIASPGDVGEERDIVANVVVPEVRRIFSLQAIPQLDEPVELETVRWETHAWPDIGEDAQDVINREIGDFDILVGVMWKRYGTPTRRSSSGTGEEFERAYDYFKRLGRPKIMFYFRTTPFYTTKKTELAQFRKVVSFREKLEKLGVLFWQYDTPLQFERNIREHLIRQILNLLGQREFFKGESPLLPPVKEKSLPEGEPVVLAYRPKVFLSHAAENEKEALSIYSLLKENGFDPWLTRESLLPGQNWHAEITKAIREADFFLALLSQVSVNKIGFLQREIRVAIEKVEELPLTDVYLIPVRLEPIGPPNELQAYQWVDYFTEGGPDALVNSMKKIWRQRH